MSPAKKERERGLYYNSSFIEMSGAMIMTVTVLNAKHTCATVLCKGDEGLSQKL